MHINTGMYFSIQNDIEQSLIKVNLHFFVITFFKEQSERARE